MTNPIRDDVDGTYDVEPEEHPGHINFSKPARRFADVQEEIAPQGVRVKVADLEDREVTVHSLKFFDGKFGPCCYAILTTPEGEIINTIFSQKIVLPKLQMVATELPVTFRVVRKEGGQYGRYWDIE